MESEEPIPEGSLFNSDLLGTECLHICLEILGWKHSWKLNRKVEVCPGGCMQGFRQWHHSEKIYSEISICNELWMSSQSLLAFMKTVREWNHLCVYIYMQTHTYVWIDLDRYRNIYVWISRKIVKECVCLYTCMCIHLWVNVYMSPYAESRQHFLCSFCAFAQSSSNPSDATIGRTPLGSSLFGGRFWFLSPS